MASSSTKSETPRDISRGPSVNSEIQILLFRISTGEFGSPDTFVECIEHLTNAMNVLINTRICEHCTFENDDDNEICEMCSKTLKLSQDEELNQYLLNQSLLSGGTKSDNTNWQCIHCTFINNAPSNLCSVCNKTQGDITSELSQNADFDNEF